MYTNKDLSKRTGLKLSTIRWRVRKLGIETRYEGKNRRGAPERVYTLEEADLIADGRSFERTGRPPKFYPDDGGGADE